MMHTNVTITMTLSEIRGLQKSLDKSLEFLKEKINPMDIGDEKDSLIHAYKELEHFKQSISY